METYAYSIMVLLAIFHVRAVLPQVTGLSMCGILTFMEEIIPYDQTSTATGSDLVASYGNPTLTNMNIYRQPGTRFLSGYYIDKDEQLLLTQNATLVTAHDPALDIVYRGHLEDSTANLKLGLMQKKTCDSGYASEIVLSDQNGGQHVSKLTASFDQPPYTYWEWLMEIINNPQRCQKYMLPVAFRDMFPFIVVYPHAHSVAQVPVLCETRTMGGGWIVFQRRSTGNVDFYRGWQDYKNGFGSLSDDFWMGLDTLHAITDSGTYELMIDLEYKSRRYSAYYDTFSVAGEDDNYRMWVGAYNGTAGDSFTYHDGMAFSTFDNDNDVDSRYHCAIENTGAWWYRNCQSSNLNGLWLHDYFYGVRWYSLGGDDSVTFSQMMIRRVFN